MTKDKTNELKSLYSVLSTLDNNISNIEDLSSSELLEIMFNIQERMMTNGDNLYWIDRSFEIFDYIYGLDNFERNDDGTFSRLSSKRHIKKSRREK